MPSPWNPANAVTFARIALVPVFAWVLLIDDGLSTEWRWAAASLFLLAAVTDRLDGYLARRYELVTDLGKLLDPIADKLLVGTALILLAWPLGELPWWVPTVILVRELGITVMRMILLRYAVIPASRGGRVKTAAQVFAIALFLLPLYDLPEALTVLAWIAMVVALVLTVVTGIDYVIAGARLRRRATDASQAVP